jgi:outer membrane protein OmpA-like peptidoglycan-associated protein
MNQLTFSVAPRSSSRTVPNLTVSNLTVSNLTVSNLTVSNFTVSGLLAGVLFAGAAFGGAATSAFAQDMLPTDNGMATYHTQPRYRESESHPLRLAGYVLHPLGWLLREGITRPISYLAGSTETTRSVFGYREPYDFRSPECFSADESAPDCRSVAPFNYEGPSAVLGTSAAPELAGEESASVAAVNNASGRSVYFPDVNFDFNKRTLSELGQGQARRLAQLLKSQGGVQIVLQGHTDFRGDEAYNEKLGMDRAEAVRSELVAQGVAAERLSTVTFGESQPVIAEESDWARAVNRRVEAHVGGETKTAE